MLVKTPLPSELGPNATPFSELFVPQVTRTTNILGAASFAVYQLSTNQFVLIGTTSCDTGAVLLVF
jgi:CDP-diacylglycerol pyrophosphatase